jgi:hypothetical protein
MLAQHVLSRDSGYLHRQTLLRRRPLVGHLHNACYDATFLFVSTEEPSSGAHLRYAALKLTLQGVVPSPVWTPLEPIVELRVLLRLKR